MGLTSDAERRVSNPDEPCATAHPERTEERKRAGTGRASVEETFKLILEQSPWEPMEPLVAHVNQKGPVKIPHWFDAQLFAKGQQYFQYNVHSMLAGKLVGLVALLRIDTITKILHSTERSDTERTALKRYADTIKHTVIWYEKDPAEEGSWADSLLEVRAIHAKIAAVHRALQSERNGSRTPPPLSQFDLAMTQFAFCGAILLRPAELGVEPTPDDVHGLIHFWRVIGYLVGISDKYNLCNEDQDTEYVLKLMDMVRSKVFSPLLLQPHTEISENLTKSLINGMWCMVPALEVDSFETITRELLADMTDEERSLRRQSLEPLALKLTISFFWIFGSFHKPFWGSLHRKCHNTIIRFGMYMIQNYPLLAWWKFGFGYRPSTG